METILFFIIMIVGHGLMMFMMPGMHGGMEKNIIMAKNLQMM
ncbi:hypothetical protein [Carnobacterium viridans]|nr:hypothetical protein [Carnobacterium viridans]